MDMGALFKLWHSTDSHKAHQYHVKEGSRPQGNEGAFRTPTRLIDSNEAHQEDV